MDLAVPSTAAELGAAAERAIVGLGGVDLARRAERDPEVRVAEVRPLLVELGAGDIDPRADFESAAAAAELVRVAARHVLPFPMVGLAMATDGSPSALASSGLLRVDHGDLFERWVTYGADGAATWAVPDGARLGSRLAPFVTGLRSDLPAGGGARDVDYLWVLWSFHLLGIAERAVELAVDHVKGRVQFGSPLADMQSVRFQLADATVAVDGLRELAWFTLWRVATSAVLSEADAVASRWHALEVVKQVLRTTQQLHGASGLCDEYDISLLVRHGQPALRLPLDADATSARLTAAVERDGFQGLF